MNRIEFYHTVRQDRGERTGLSVSHHGKYSKGFELFEHGDDEANPVIDWAVDVVVTTKSAPKTVSQAKLWFRQNIDVISNSLQDAAHELKSGLDADGVPWQFEKKSPIGPVQVSVNATAAHTGKEIAKHLLHFVRTKLYPTLEKLDVSDSAAVACA